MNYRQLHFVPDTDAGPFDEAELRAFENWLNRCQWTKICRFDPSYVEYLRQQNGGKPIERNFTTPTGTTHVVHSFLNFANREGRLGDQNVGVVWSRTQDRLSNFLVPFAEMFNGDMLCFDHSQPGAPQIVIWFHELSRSEQPPATEFVALNFHAFLEMLSGSDEPEIPRRLTRSQDKAELIAYIRDAFAGVTLGDGVGLLQAEGLDDNALPAELAKLREQDEKLDWSKISPDLLHDCPSSLSYFDGEGMRFHLPAFLIADLEGTFQTNVALKVVYSGSDHYFGLLTSVQREAVRRYLAFLYHWPHPFQEHIPEALAGYWNDLDDPADEE